MGLAAEDAAAGGHANGDGRGKVSGRAVPQTGGLRNNLVVGRIHVVGELDLDARPQPVGCHTDRSANDGTLVDGCVEAPVRSESLLQALGAAEDAAEVADVLSEYDHPFVTFHGHNVCVADGFDHRHP